MQSEHPTTGMDVLFLDVGQGDASIIFPPPPALPIVVDCKDADVVTKTLEMRGHEQIHALILTHLDLDHVAGTLSLLKRFEHPELRVYVSADRDITDRTARHKKAKKIVDEVIVGGINGQWQVYPSTRQAAPIASGSNWAVEVAAPEHHQTLSDERTDRRRLANEHSAVVRVSFAQHRIWIGGDAQLGTWHTLHGRRHGLIADVFRVPHHGGKLDQGRVPSGWDVGKLYDKVEPAQAIVSVGSLNGHDHPNPAWLAPLLPPQTSCQLYCTQVTPRCEPTVNTEAWKPREMLKQVRRHNHPFAEPLWRHYRDADREDKSTHRGGKEMPCAGTVVISMTVDLLRVLPDVSAHEVTVSAWETPLCDQDDFDYEVDR